MNREERFTQTLKAKISNTGPGLAAGCPSLEKDLKRRMMDHISTIEYNEKEIRICKERIEVAKKEIEKIVREWEF